MKLRFKVLGVGACLAMATAGLGVSANAGAKPLGATKGTHTQTYGTYIDGSGGTYPSGAIGIGQISTTGGPTPNTTDACLIFPLSSNGTAPLASNSQLISDPTKPNPGSEGGSWHIAYGSSAPYTSGTLDTLATDESLAPLTPPATCDQNNTPASVAVSFLTSPAGTVTMTEASSSNVINGIADISNDQEQVVGPCAATPKVDGVAYSANGTGASSTVDVTWGTVSGSGTCTWPYTTAAIKQPSISKPIWDTGGSPATSFVCGGAGAPRNVYDTEGNSNSSSQPAMTYLECTQDNSATNVIKGSTESIVVSGLNSGDEVYVQQVQTNVTAAQYTQVGIDMNGTGTGGNKIPIGKCKLIIQGSVGSQQFVLQCDGWNYIPFAIISRYFGTSDGAGLSDPDGLFKPKVDTVVCAIDGSIAKPGDCSE